MNRDNTLQIQLAGHFALVFLSRGIHDPWVPCKIPDPWYYMPTSLIHLEGKRGSVFLLMIHVSLFFFNGLLQRETKGKTEILSSKIRHTHVGQKLNGIGPSKRGEAPCSFCFPLSRGEQRT